MRNKASPETDSVRNGFSSSLLLLFVLEFYYTSMRLVTLLLASLHTDYLNFDF